MKKCLASLENSIHLSATGLISICLVQRVEVSQC